MTDLHILGAILAATLATFALRALPFLLPKRLLDVPAVQRSARIMPLRVMVTLVLHSFNGLDFTLDGSAPPYLIGVLVVLFLHLAFGLPFLSIVGGVGGHMLALALWP